MGRPVRTAKPRSSERGVVTGKLVPPRYRELRRWLRQAGFEPQSERGKGDHEVWKHPDGRLVVLDPGEDPPPIGTFKKILRDAGLPEAPFRERGKAGKRKKG
ncbi:type II toxin-antitoxin system HicA family toxin [Thermus sp.]|jgi:predicted RNA binding protein YcfA (HicA-like mRNA interferase family)|uniref:type II toxin-antitoxin system HicA family toxin n=1 Tax=Thermus sp. TaxID=275 RepID=UPI0025F837FE|nr:type II toxin-antitoxin system HicA family toxin [Thermus sp.]MCS6869588.1 type II toxin-antitoxin system HicA family toxin [Thermus sp.]MCX7850187.1 type II toxin-antitoxin system HicA family toxin [Thermus sp.]MDW8017199.1 type II toxin-antitoxin system HicA family toxin [Thermus sp.]MDW8357633.1 type II toxin-antitoxin system HicA family toxin [Thermus sp.]